MKIPLKYQSSNYDCVPTTFLNAINYLYEREEIPPEVVKTVMLYSLDTFNKNGEMGKAGTSGFAVRFICDWLNQYSEIKDFKINCEYITGKAVNLGLKSKIINCIKNHGIALVRVQVNKWHYVLITSVDDDFIYLFDPYYRKKTFNDPEIDMIDDNPFEANRKVSRERVESIENVKYALGPVEERECILMCRN
jgi:hypothetical protein